METKQPRPASLPPQDTKSIAHVMVYLIYLGVVIPIKRLLGYKPPVPQWSIQEEISVCFLKYMTTATTESVRRIEDFVLGIANAAVKVPRKPLDDAAGFRGLWYGDLTDATADATVLFIHGGGYSACSVHTHADAITTIQSMAKRHHGKSIRLLALAYSLAPEAQFPIQQNEALAAYTYLVRETTKPILLMGDSAGGNLVFSLLLALKKPENQHLRAPAAAVLASPWCTLDTETLSESFTTHATTDYITVPKMYSCIHDFVGSASTKDPMVSPFYGDFTGSCPILLHYGGKELFADDIELMAAKLKSQAVDVTLVKEPLAPHDTAFLKAFFGTMSTSASRVIAAYIASFAHSGAGAF
ncbi:Aste57867_745 [Aphanomyces stellatus]|uniref:Aste57867_745 protein n=1 Tax=Aphanomyces stellatus TaxID=120398 RepID=A0A485K8F0_9STRA|nr:hypothetical protein As57867_000744 [Aphanomyces stellatus]VFT77969.1 Aste57867_745 [Aphanomyces stellatus]